MRAKKAFGVAVLMAIVLVLASCDFEGGVRGSGISTAQGNVARIVVSGLRRSSHRPVWLARLWSLLALEPTAQAQSGLSGIRVIVEGEGAEGRTDDEGRFTVRGLFDGPVSILFQRADDGLAARITVDVPAEGVLTLNDVTIDNPRGEAFAESQEAKFEGSISAIDCPGQEITVVSREDDPDTQAYAVHLGGSTLHDRRGRSLTCDQLSEGARVRIDGVVDDDGTIGNADIEIEG